MRVRVCDYAPRVCVLSGTTLDIPLEYLEHVQVHTSNVTPKEKGNIPM